MLDFNSAGGRERANLLLLAQTTGLQQIIFTRSSCPYDALAQTAEGRIVMFEVKCRLSKHDQYESTLIEYPKYADLMQRWSKHECHLPIYVEFYQDGFARLFNLSKLEIEWGTKRLNKTTFGDYGDVEKKVGYIDYALGRLVKMPKNLFEELG